MNLLINLHGLNTVYNSKGDILWENSNDNRAVTTSQDVSFGGGTYGGWSAFYSLLQTHLTYYPDAKIFPAHSTSGRDINWVNGVYSPPDIYFKIIQNDPGNRNYGFTLQRIQNDNWVNIHTDSTNAKSVFNYLNFIFVNGTYSHQEWISKLWISVDPNIWLGI